MTYPTKVKSEWLSTLYLQARTLTITEFKSNFFQHLNKLIPFDSAIWASRSDILNVAREYWVEDTFLFQLPGGFMENYYQIASATNTTDPLNQHLSEHTNKFFTTWDVISKEQWERTPFYSQHCKKYGIENILGALNAPSEFSTVGHAISLYRKHFNAMFTLAEKSLINELAPNFIEAFKVNIMASLAKEPGVNVTAKAIVDRYGEIIYEAEESFSFLAHKIKIMTDGKMMLDGLRNLSGEREIKIEGFTVRAYINNGLIFIEILTPPIHDLLTHRQLEVCSLISKGYKSNEIAELLGIGKKTVDAHTGEIFSRLSVRSRAALTSLFLQQASHQA